MWVVSLSASEWMTLQPAVLPGGTRKYRTGSAG
ncbi:hypothetical protein SMD44_00884 [Streptomyces alboflavus]|uniref:Uncharacterized protein n=1 Tax=Streptomyces alboflavus TaxID=67267 RepID=A0A1Z1W4Y4_9ACTN|nr:hypothetical protein SMD44_00884 [Streptomyces alboflavus]